METIVIVGGGAGGLELATRLGDSLGAAQQARIVLVDRWPGHFWKPLLHTVASGACDPCGDQLSFSAQAQAHDFDFIRGELLHLDRARRNITLSPDDGSDACRLLAYDRLVLALGAVTNFYGVPGAAEHALTLDSLADAEDFRQRFYDICVRAGERDTPVNVLIVGGGATGVELAAELSHSARALAVWRGRAQALPDRQRIRITLVERGPRLLPQLHAAQAERAMRELAALGINVRTDTSVAAVGADEVIDVNGQRLPSDLTLWAAGVEAPPLCATLGLSTNNLQQIIVDASLRCANDRHIYALGDCANHVCPERGAAPPRAAVAHQQAMFLAGHLAAPAAHADAAQGPAFRYQDYGALISLGQQAAVGALHGDLPLRPVRQRQ